MRARFLSCPVLFFLLTAGCAGPPSARLTPENGTSPDSPGITTASVAADTTMPGPGLTLVEEPDIQTPIAEAIHKGVVKRRVFTESNDGAGNEVLVYGQAEDGSFSDPTHYATGGVGSGAGLGSQGAVTLSADGSALLAVNAGSNDISVFAVGKTALALTDRVASGGFMPVSVTVSGNVVYVVNAGGTGSVAGFVLSQVGKLTAIAGGTRSLKHTGAGPAQVAVTPSAGVVLVTEKARSCIEKFPLHSDGKLDAGICVPSAGTTPFGFAFAPSVTDGNGGIYDRLLVSEAFGGAKAASALSSYFVDGTDVNVADASVPTKQTAACWVAVDRDGVFAYTTNTGSASVSGYRVALDATLTLLDADGLTAVLASGSNPTDVATARAANVLQVIGAGTHELSSYSIDKAGALTHLSTLHGLPAAAAGLASE